MAGLSTLSLFSVVRKLLASSSRSFPIRSSGVYSISHQTVHDDSHSKADDIIIPPPPKRPTTSYLRFYKDIYPFVKNNMIGVKMPQVVKHIANEWRQLQPEERTKYKDAYKRDKEKYLIEEAEWKDSLTNEQKTLIEETKIQKKITKARQRQRRARKKLNKEKRDLGKPKRFVSSFVIFCQEKRKEYNIDLKEGLKIASEEWKKMSNIEKLPYIEQSLKEREAYQIKLKQWQEDMIQEGKQHLLEKKPKRRYDTKPKLKHLEENEE